MNLDFPKRAFRISVVWLAVFVLSACSDDAPVRVATKPPPDGEKCFDFRDYLHTAALVKTPGQAAAVAVDDGGTLYVADGNYGLQIIDASQPWMPRFLGSVDTADVVLDVALDFTTVDSVVCLAYGETGLIVADVTRPAAPVIIGGARTPGSAVGVAVADTLAFVADDVIGLMVFDIGDPSSPEPLGVENTPGKASSVAVSGPLAYVADELLGLRVVNVFNPSEPWLVNAVPTPGKATDVSVRGDYAFVADGESGVQIVDISSLGSESIVSTFDTPDEARGLHLANGYLYVAAGDSGLRVVEVVVDAGAAPQMREVNRLPSYSSSVGVCGAGDYVYVAEGKGRVRVVDAAEPMPPPVFDRLIPFGADAVGYIETSPAFVYGVAAGLGLFIAELQGDAGLRALGNAPALLDQPTDIVVRDGFAYVPARNSGVVVFDVRDPQNPQVSHGLTAVMPAVGVDATDNAVYVATGGDFLAVYPQGMGPPVLARVLGIKATDVAADSAYAYVTSEANELLVVNVENVHAPFALARIGIEGAGERVLVREGYAFIVTSGRFASGRIGIGIYDLQLPFLPAPVQFVETTGKVERIAVSGTTIYAAQGKGGLEVIDISDMSNPRVIGSIGTNGAIVDAAAAGGFLFVSEDAEGFFVTSAQSCDTP